MCNKHNPDDIAYPDYSPCDYHGPCNLGPFNDPDNESCDNFNDNIRINHSYDDTCDIADNHCYHNYCHHDGYTIAGEPGSGILC